MFAKFIIPEELVKEIARGLQVSLAFGHELVEARLQLIGALDELVELAALRAHVQVHVLLSGVRRQDGGGRGGLSALLGGVHVLDAAGLALAELVHTLRLDLQIEVLHLCAPLAPLVLQDTKKTMC